MLKKILVTAITIYEKKIKFIKLLLKKHMLIQQENDQCLNNLVFMIFIDFHFNAKFRAFILKISPYTTRKLSNCGGCKNRRYMSPIAALFWPAAVHEIYCGVPYACRNSSSILRRTIAAG